MKIRQQYFKIILFTVILSFLQFETNAQEQLRNYNVINSKNSRIIFTDDFTKGNVNKWNIRKNLEKQAVIVGQKYYLEAKNKGFTVQPYKYNIELPNNFQIDLNIKFHKGEFKFLNRLMSLNMKIKNNHKALKLAVLNKINFKTNQFNKITIRKIRNNYFYFINEKFIKLVRRENLKYNKLFIGVTPYTKLIIDKVVVKQITKPEKQLVIEEKERVKIIINSPQFDRGFLKLTNSNENLIKIEGKISPYVKDANLQINLSDVFYSQTGNFSKELKLINGKNNIVIRLYKQQELIAERNLIIDHYSSEVSDNDINSPFVIDEKRLALIIGNSDYELGGSLANPVNDANDMSVALKKIGFEVLLVTNASQKEIKKAVDDFGEKLKNYDAGLFFYAGHGVQVKGANYLIPVDANLKTENDVEYDCVNAERVLAKMEDASSKINIVILDACRNNPFERSWTRSGNGNGLAFMNAPSGSLIAYATSPGTTASDGSNRNGLYTSALLEHINTKEITILEMFQRVRATVMEKSKNKQVPWESTSLKGNFYFIPKK